MDVGSELTTAVGVAEEVADYCEDGTESLEGNMPSRVDDLDKVSLERKRGQRRIEGTDPKDHAGGEDDAESEDLDQYVYPENSIL